MSSPEVFESLSRGDEVKVTFKSTGMYNAGSSTTHHGTVVKKISGEEDGDPFDYKVIYRVGERGEVFLFDGKVEYVYTHENDKLRQLEGVNANLILKEDSEN